MKLKSIWTYVIVFVVVFGATAFYKLNSNKKIDVEDFDTFYEKFLTDSTFQMSRINFPIDGLPSQADSIHFADGYQWTENTWDLHKKINYEEIGYEREVLKLEYLIKETLYHPQGWGVERTFRINEEGNWYLIKYVAPNAITRNNLRAG